MTQICISTIPAQQDLEKQKNFFWNRLPAPVGRSLAIVGRCNASPGIYSRGSRVKSAPGPVFRRVGLYPARQARDRRVPPEKMEDRINRVATKCLPRFSTRCPDDEYNRGHFSAGFAGRAGSAA